jgi:hypothetical protein
MNSPLRTLYHVRESAPSAAPNPETAHRISKGERNANADPLLEIYYTPYKRG